MSKQDDQKNLENLCLKLKLSSRAIEVVKSVTINLKNLKTSAALFKSGEARRRELANLIKQAKALCATLQRIDQKNDWLMRSALGEAGFPGPLLNPDADVQVWFEHWRSGTGAALEMIVKAATDTSDKIPTTALRRGRVSSRHMQAIQLSNLDQMMEIDKGPRLSRNGEFRELCDAIFLAAGVGTESEGAIRFLEDFRAMQCIALDISVNSNTGVCTVIGDIIEDPKSGVRIFEIKLRRRLKVDDAVRFTHAMGALPAPLQMDTDFYIHSVPTEATFTLSATIGGAALSMFWGDDRTSFYSRVLIGGGIERNILWDY